MSTDTQSSLKCLLIKELNVAEEDELDIERKKTKELKKLFKVLYCENNVSFTYLFLIFYLKIFASIVKSEFDDWQNFQSIKYQEISDLLMYLQAKFESHYLQSLKENYGILYSSSAFMYACFDKDNSISHNETLRKKALIELGHLESYLDSINYTNVSSILGVTVQKPNFIPQLGSESLANFRYTELSYLNKTFEEYAIKGSIYSNFFEIGLTEFHDDVKSQIICNEPSKITRIFELFFEKKLLKIELKEIPKLIRTLFDIPNKYYPKYPVGIPTFEIVSKEFSVEMKATLRILRSSKIIEGKVKDIALIFNRVFPIEGMSIRSIENSMKPATKIDFKVLSASEIMGVCNISSSLKINVPRS